MFVLCSIAVMINPDFWYDHNNPSKLLAALWEVRRLCTSAEQTNRITRKPGSYLRLEAINKAIDEYGRLRVWKPRVFFESAAQGGVSIGLAAAPDAPTC
jgi:hypothetical protein